MRSRLFHTIVVVGLSTVACSASKEPDPTEDAAAKPKKDAADESLPIFMPFGGDASADVNQPDGSTGICNPLPCYV